MSNLMWNHKQNETRDVFDSLETVDACLIRYKTIFRQDNTQDQFFQKMIGIVSLKVGTMVRLDQMMWRRLILSEWKLILFKWE